MIWWDLASDLATHLAGAVPAANIVIGARPNAPVSDEIRIRVTDDSDQNPLAVQQYKGTLGIRLECWSFNATNASTAYESLSDLNDAVIAGLRTWSPNGIYFDDITMGISFDDDLFQPSVGNLMALVISWRRTDFL